MSANISNDQNKKRHKYRNESPTDIQQQKIRPLAPAATYIHCKLQKPRVKDKTKILDANHGGVPQK